jgi:hypothetical protein
MTKKLTFHSAANSNLSIMARQRLKVFWNELAETMKLALCFPAPNVDINSNDIDD